MSMVSIKNFISPFRNTVHTVTIVLVTILFALFRLQGGGVNANFSRNRLPVDSRIEIPEANIEAEEPAQIDNLIKPVESAPEQKLPARTKTEDLADSGSIKISDDEGDLLKQMIGQKPLVEEPAVPANKNNKKDPTGGLAEIEKSLGMR